MVDDLELIEFVEMEVREFFLKYGYSGDEVLIVKGFVLKVLELIL